MAFNNDIVNLLTNLASKLSSYNIEDLLASVSALQLIPENKECSVRLEALTHAIASIKENSTGDGRTTPDKLKKMCNSEPLSNESITKLEDPFEYPFTEAFTFHGGSFTVFPGITEETVFILRHLSIALFHLAEPSLNQEFVNEAASLFSAILHLSNAIAEKAGIERNLETITNLKREIVVPDYQKLSQLKKSVVFTKDELMGLLDSNFLSPNVLDPLILPLGHIKIQDYTLENSPLFHKPIIKINDLFIVVLPGKLLEALRFEILRQAVRYRVEQLVVNLYNNSVWYQLVEALGYLNNDLTDISIPNDSAVSSSQEGIFKFDTDKLLYAYLLTDPLSNYEFNNRLSKWDIERTKPVIERQIRNTINYILSLEKPPNEILSVIFIQGIGRPFLFSKNSVTGTPSLMLIMSVADLTTLSLLEANDSLVLWKFAHHAYKVRQQTKVFSYGILDEFYFYRQNDYSFYISDHGLPNPLIIRVGGSGKLRCQVVRQMDPHALLSFTQGEIMEVAALHASREIPIYTPLSILGNRAVILVEGYSIPIWIIGTEYANDADRKLHRLYTHFVDTIGYWLWQLSSSLSPLIFNLNQQFSILLLELYLIPCEAWGFYEPDKVDSSETSFTIDFSQERNTFSLIIHHTILSTLLDINNAGERELMRAIISSFREVLPEDRNNLSNDIIEHVLNKHIPLSNKKKFTVFDALKDPRLDDSVPKYRKVQEADYDERIDELGKHLSSQENYSFGQLPDDKRVEVLNKAVRYLFNELKKLISTLNPQGLLEWLVSYNEAGVHESAINKLLLPVEMACFGSESTNVKTLRKKTQEQSITAISSRFLIEYISANPPNGLRKISMSVYDELLSIAALLSNLGFASDLVHFELANIQMAMLPSCRLGIDQQTFTNAMDAYWPVFSIGELERTTQAYEHYFQNNESSEITDIISEIDAIAPDEFGHTLTDLLNFMSKAIEIANDFPYGTSILPLEEFIRAMIDNLGWSREKVNGVTDILALRSRANFLVPPSPYKSVDVFPWRFNRPLSYMRCPFLLRFVNGVEEILWGKRHVYTTSAYLVYLLMSGKFQAQSRRMKELLGKFNDQRGEPFNDQVADFLEKDSKLIVKRRVKKIGHLRLVGDKGDLGDIDVLAVDIKKRQIKVIECKDLVAARTPNELSNELTNLFLGKQNKESVIQRHQKRVDWIKNYLHNVLPWLGIDLEKSSKGKWKVDPVIVVNYELLTPFIANSKIPVLSFVQIQKFGI
jgi:hypothetical protein